MNRLLLLSVGCFVLAGCSVNFTEPSGRRCDDTHGCPPNEVCIDQRCQAPAEEPPDGGGLPDGGDLPDGGGLPDGGSPPDGGPQPTVEVSLSPMTVAVATERTLGFTATVRNASDSTVTWSITEGASGGTIDANGLYTAPAQTGTFHVVATSVQDPTRSATSAVNVLALPTGLVLHFSADRLLGEGVALPADGTPVSSWMDLSGNAHDMSQTDTPRQPVFKARARNGLPTVAFDGDTSPGNGDYLRTAALASALPQPLTVFFAYKAPPVEANKTLVDAPISAGTNRVRVQATTIPLGGLQLYASKFTSPGSQKTVGTFQTVTAIFDGVNSRLRTNGTEETMSPNRDSGAASLGGVQLGGRQDLLDTSFAATELPELLVFDHLLSESEIGIVETYLHDRYIP